MEAESRVDSYTMPLDAELAKAYLESYEIPVRLEGETLVGSAYALGPMIGGITLYVDEQDEQRARALLEQYHRALHEPSRDSDNDESDDVDDAIDGIASQPKSDSHSRSTAELRKGHALRDASDDDATHAWVSSLAGLVVFPVFSHCYSIFCLLRIPRSALSVRGKQRYLTAWVINLTVLLAAVVVLWRWFTRR